MRITGGTHRSRKLETPKGDAIRPTSDKVRQAIFNMLNSRGHVLDAIVIDAFCGTGALGLEALSQGAKFCTFFDKNKNSISLCKTNVAALKEEEQSNIQFQDVTKVKERPDGVEPAELVFLDPPYRQNFIPLAVSKLYENKWLAPEACFLMEVAKDETLQSDHIKIENEKIYGDTKILIGYLK